MVAPAANASGNEKPPASSSDDTSVDAAAAEAKDAPASSAWSWGSPEDTASSGSNDTGSAKADSDAEGRTGSTPTETTTSPSWSWSSSTNGTDDADHAAADHDRSHEDAAIVDASEQGNQDADSPAETETSVDSGSTSPLANITSSTNDSATDTASTWSWGESHSEPEQDISGASGVESSGATSDVTDSDANTDVNAEEIAVLSTPVPDTAEEEALSTTSEGSAAGSNSSGDRSSSDVDVSSAFTDDTDTEGEGEETLSSWAASWNDAEADANADAASPDTGSTDTIGATTTTSATNESDPAATTADSQVDFTEQSPLEGAPGGQQSSSDGSTANTEPADTTGYGIEGAPGGQLPEDDTTTTDTESRTNPDVSVPPAHEREEAYRDQTSAADDIGSAGDERAITATDDLVDDEGTTAAANEPIDEPSGAHGSEVTPGTDSDLVDPLAGMEVSPTSTITATGQDSGSTGATSTESARNRAEQLIDELRDLLPSLTASGSDATDSSAGIAAGAGSDQDLQPVIDELTAARPQAGSFDDLRTALEKARTNPRDVDTMLDLVGRVDDLIALLDSQDRLNTAAGHAIDQLHQSGTHPEN